ncbi:unnamed protein product [Vitrella brassicaformis CCMP3155]|uniref:Uncharacterized protein n=1 Tax=Vitrella brassicaformis (strain CCMP3155) TaxID=1169540 RepID=A0A0G4GPQ7_VITBC|nr:unnamed protein product [Vitrella brassicaformis CCMP3155]|mmetsp:Transcript_39961/g.100006  ORF Transcript_39961/g.100006 Transcript_39961/m.100006 type:complete len:188 (-) Transcript_39961:35-598(-)|eukprot:CEM32351.1 unnamed protein product [Vitrella brassicaformis CCMP3155]
MAWVPHQWTIGARNTSTVILCVVMLIGAVVLGYKGGQFWKSFVEIAARGTFIRLSGVIAHYIGALLHCIESRIRQTNEYQMFHSDLEEDSVDWVLHLAAQVIMVERQVMIRYDEAAKRLSAANFCLVPLCWLVGWIFSEIKWDGPSHWVPGVVSDWLYWFIPVMVGEFLYNYIYALYIYFMIGDPYR